MPPGSNTPLAEVPSYGVLMARRHETEADYVVEEIETLGFAVLDGALPADEVARLRTSADSLVAGTSEPHGNDVVRAPWSIDPNFLTLIDIPIVIEVVRTLIPGRVVLNQQNLVNNPGTGEEYSQARFHRDLPYQHFVASRPLAINVLVCVDDFTLENGATFVVPGSHKEEKFPSSRFIAKHAFPVTASAGSLIFLHSMTYHAGGVNKTGQSRLAVNHVYASPMLRPQLDHTKLVCSSVLNSFSPEHRELLDLSS